MKKLSLLSLLWCLMLQIALGQNQKVYSTKQVSETISIDAEIDEKSWGKVKWEGNFIQTEPENGSKPTFDTQFKILYDQKHLYVAIRAFDNHPDSIVVSNKPRDFFDGDYVEINIDSDYDKKDAFSFTITAGGIRGDEHIKTHENWFNDWNPNWTAKTKIDDKGWIAELKIPFSELEVYDKKEHWGIQVNRSLERLDEGSSWTSIPDEDKWVEYFGLLTGIENIPITKSFSFKGKIESEATQKDFKDLYNSLVSSYPSLYRYHSEDFISNNYDKVLQALKEDMTLLDFYKTVSSFVSKIGDGHMRVELPDHFMKNYYSSLKKLPFKLNVTKDIVFVSENYSKNKVLDGAQVISINGELVRNIVDDIAKIIPSDGHNLTGKYHRMSYDFDFYYSLLTGFLDEVKIDVLPKGQEKVHTVTLPLLIDAEIEKMKSDSNESYKSFDYSVKNNVAIMTIRTFNNAEGFKGFVDESFKKIAESNIKKLILDFRGNGGGDETNAIHLYAYLTTKPFKYYDRYEMNVQPNTKIDQESTLVSYETLNFFSEVTSKDTMGRTIISDLEPLRGRFLNPSEWQKPIEKHNFTGQVVALIDGGSFSATSEICAIIQRDKRATLVGEETGGTFDGNTSGIYDQITLPKSRLKVKIPLIKYVMDSDGASYNFGRGVLPEYQVSYMHGIDQPLDFAINYLNN
ncbi:S41 family peptidase [Winogradskyella sp.]|uniref:S41 family peptidase n=1 Tax=Winogradskyella sp. TaxID=1883156 RepID=UPI00260ED25A|nr:S41 family peptidase [Winogradskyella sp.]